MSIQQWISLSMICILGAFSPGPSLMVILSITACRGRHSGLMASYGHGLGVFLYALLSATGLSLFLVRHSELFVLVQILGACFLIYLSFRILYSILLKKKSDKFETEPLSQPSSFRYGFLIALLNLKIAIFFLSLFSQFLEEGQSFYIHLGMATVAGTIDTFAYIMMVTFASTSFALKFFSGYRTSLELFFASLLTVVGFSLFFKLFGLI